MANKLVSLIVPVYNMADYLPALWDSLSSSGMQQALAETVFVNDGSTDETKSVLENLKRTYPKLQIVDLGENQGRFVARLKGAEAAKGTHILFIDARAAFSPEFGSAFEQLLSKHEALMGMLKIDINKSVYNLYWQRTHEWVFHRHFKDAKAGFFLTESNYESYAKGTTLFMCPKKDFIAACEMYKNDPPHSDDTLLMREIVKTTPIWVQESLGIAWEPRQNYWDFVVRLWERGPQFAEYHVFERQGLYFILFALWTAAVFITLGMIVIVPWLGATVLVSGLALLALSTALFSKSPIEFLRMVPLHVGTILAYGLGAIYGVGVNLKLFRKPRPTAARR